MLYGIHLSPNSFRRALRLKRAVRNAFNFSRETSMGISGHHNRNELLRNGARTSESLARANAAGHVRERDVR